MIVRGQISINGKSYEKGQHISPWKIYPFFLIHMAAFGGSGFVMAYFSPAPLLFLYLHGGFAVLVYLIFYITIFGVDEVKWMLANALLGIFGLYSEIAILLSWAGKDIHSFPLQVHVIPFMYYVLYTFLLRQVILELTNSNGDKAKKHKVNVLYFLISISVYTAFYFIGNT